MAGKDPQEAVFHRSAEVVSRGKGDDEAVRIELSFASEDPYKRWFGTEVLGLKRGEYDFSRLNNEAPFLADHMNSIDSVLGVVEKAWVKERKAFATVRLADTEKAKEYMKLLDAGMGRKISVGYRVEKFEKDTSGDDDVFRAVRWLPMEISAVAAAADDTVGVGRSLITGLTTEGTKVTTETETKGADAPNLDLVVKDATGKERARIAEIVTYGKVHKDVGGRELASDVIAAGGTLEDLKDALIKASNDRFNKRTEELAAKGQSPTQSDGDLDLSEKDARGLSLANFVRSEMEQKPKLAEREREVIGAWQKQMLDRGVKPLHGTPLPPVMIREAARQEMVLQEMRANILAGNGAFSRLTTTTVDEGSNMTTIADLVGTDHLGDAFVPYLWNMSAFLPFVTNMNGLVGNIDIPREMTVITASWVAQTAAVAGTVAAADKINLTPKQLAVRTQYGRTVFNQSDPSINGILMNQGARGMALAEDAAVVNGTGSNNQPQGILNYTSAATKTHGATHQVAITGAAAATAANGNFLTHTDLVECETRLNDANYGTANAMWFVNAATKGKLKTTTKVASSTFPIYLWDGADNEGPLNGYNARVSQQIPRNSARTSTAPTGNTSAAIFCDPQQILCAHWSGVDVVVDPYTDSASGYVNITWYRDIDVNLLQPQAFAVIPYGIATTAT